MAHSVCEPLNSALQSMCETEKNNVIKKKENKELKRSETLK